MESIKIYNVEVMENYFHFTTTLRYEYCWERMKLVNRGICWERIKLVNRGICWERMKLVNEEFVGKELS